MNKNKLKMKWILGIHKTLPDFPSYQDLLFDICDYLYSKDELDNSFSKNMFKAIYGKDEFNKHSIQIDEGLNQLVKEDLISIERETNISVFYLLNKKTITFL